MYCYGLNLLILPHEDSIFILLDFINKTTQQKFTELRLAAIFAIGVILYVLVVVIIL